MSSPSGALANANDKPNHENSSDGAKGWNFFFWGHGRERTVVPNEALSSENTADNHQENDTLLNTVCSILYESFTVLLYSL